MVSTATLLAIRHLVLRGIDKETFPVFCFFLLPYVSYCCFSVDRGDPAISIPFPLPPQFIPGVRASSAFEFSCVSGIASGSLFPCFPRFSEL